MSELFPVPIAQSQLDQFKKQANILSQEIQSIIGGKLLIGRRALSLYAAACDYNSYNAVSVASKQITLPPDEDDNLFILTDERLPIMATKIATYSPLIDVTQALQALINLRNKISLGHNIINVAKKYLAPAFSSSLDALPNKLIPTIFNDDLKYAIESALNDYDVVFLSGRPGIGKTSALLRVLPKGLIIDKTKENNPTLDQIDFDTIKKASGAVFAIDESHRVSGSDIVRLVDFACENNAKVIISTQLLWESPIEKIHDRVLEQNGQVCLLHIHKIGVVPKVHRITPDFFSSSAKIKNLLRPITTVHDFTEVKGTEQTNFLLSENYHFEGPVSKMQFESKRKSLANSVLQKRVIDEQPVPLTHEVGKQNDNCETEHIDLVSKEAIEKEEFFEQLSKDMDQQALETLRKQLPKMDKRVPEQWCQYIMLEHFIPQQCAADFLKAELGVSIELLPEPDLKISVTNTDGSNALDDGYSILIVTEEQSSIILNWIRNYHREGTAFDNKITDQINGFLIDAFNQSELELKEQYVTKTPLKDISFELIGNQLKISNQYIL